MGRLLLMYGAIHVNVLLVSLFLLDVIDEGLLTILQVSFLLLLLYKWRRYGIPKRNISLIERGLWLMGSLGVMVSLAILVSFLFSGTETNQRTVLSIQDQVSLVSFIFSQCQCGGRSGVSRVIMEKADFSSHTGCFDQFPLFLGAPPF